MTSGAAWPEESIVMLNDERIRVFDSQGDAYKQAFRIFLENTDQKKNARRWLNRLVESLPSKGTFVDAGAGSGEVTAWLSRFFQRTIAIEPNPFFLAQLQQSVPTAGLIDTPILAAQPPKDADLVLCSHTFYYIERRRWLEHLERLVSWISPRGVTVVVLQNRDTDCMVMLEHFFGCRFDLTELAEDFRARLEDRYLVETTRDEAYVEAKDFESAYVIAEFMLNLLPIEQPPLKSRVEEYIRARFSTSSGGYRFSNHQDFLQIRRRR